MIVEEAHILDPGDKRASDLQEDDQIMAEERDGNFTEKEMSSSSMEILGIKAGSLHQELAKQLSKEKVTRPGGVTNQVSRN